MAELSVIVPFYNADAYLDRCLSSIISQYYSDIQIILVDDGSDDASINICRKYEANDRRIEIYKKKNGGLVSARKFGVEKARGKYVAYVDADDWVEADCFEHMLSQAHKSGADIVAAGHFHDIGNESSRVHNSFEVGTYKTREILDKVLYFGSFYKYGIQPHIWNKLFRTEILKNVQMKVPEEIFMGEDAAVTYPAIVMSGSISVTDYCGYHYVQNDGSMSKNKIDDERVRLELLISYLSDFFENNGVANKMSDQLKTYKRFLFSMRDIGVFDEEVLRPFGGIPYESRVIIYGAGIFGKQIYRYLKESERIKIVGWVDRNWEKYSGSGFDVISPESINKNKGYDYIIIANLSETVADAIRCSLVEMGIDGKKIRWFSEEFLKRNR